MENKSNILAHHESLRAEIKNLQQQITSMQKDLIYISELKDTFRERSNRLSKELVDMQLKQKKAISALEDFDNDLNFIKTTTTKAWASFYLVIKSALGAKE